MNPTARVCPVPWCEAHLNEWCVDRDGIIRRCHLLRRVWVLIQRWRSK